jgi:hypothetical protein
MTKREMVRGSRVAQIRDIVASSAAPLTVKQIAFAVPCSIGAVERAVEDDPVLGEQFATGKIALPVEAKGRHRWLSRVEKKHLRQITYLPRPQREVSIPLPDLSGIMNPSIRNEVERELRANRARAIRENGSPVVIVNCLFERDRLRIEAAERQQNNEVMAQQDFDRRVSLVVERLLAEHGLSPKVAA